MLVFFSNKEKGENWKEAGRKLERIWKIIPIVFILLDYSGFEVTIKLCFPDQL